MGRGTWVGVGVGSLVGVGIGSRVGVDRDTLVGAEVTVAAGRGVRAGVCVGTTRVTVAEGIAGTVVAWATCREVGVGEGVSRSRAAPGTCSACDPNCPLSQPVKLSLVDSSPSTSSATAVSAANTTTKPRSLRSFRIASALRRFLDLDSSLGMSLAQVYPVSGTPWPGGMTSVRTSGVLKILLQLRHLQGKYACTRLLILMRCPEQSGQTPTSRSVRLRWA